MPNAQNVTKVWSHNGDQWYDAVSDSIIPKNEWTHFGFTVNEGEAKVYINGEEKFSDGNFPDVFTTVNAQFSLGVNYWDMPFKGLMDEVRVYDGLVLTETEMQSLFENPVVEEPGAEEPGAEEPGAEEPGAEKPGTDKPGTDKPSAENPQTDNTGKALPNTATNEYNWIIGGLFLLAAGLSISLVKRKRAMKVK